MKKLYFILLLFLNLGFIAKSQSPQLVLQTGPDAYLMSSAISPDEKYLASAGAGGFVKIWDIKTGKELTTLQVGAQIYHISFDPASKLLAVGSNSDINVASLTVWDFLTGEKHVEFYGSEYWTNKVEFSPNGAYIMGSYPDEIKVFNINNKSIIWSASKNNFNLFAMHPTKNVIVYSEDTKNLFSVDLNTFDKKSLYENPDSISAIGISPNGKYLQLKVKNEIKIIDLKTQKPYKTISSPYLLRFTPDEQNYLSGGKIISLKKGELFTSFNYKLHTGTITSTLFSHSGKYFISTDNNRTIIIWDVKSGKIIKKIGKHNINNKILSSYSKNTQLEFLMADSITIKKFNISNEIGYETVYQNTSKIINKLSLSDNNIYVLNKDSTLNIINPENENSEFVKKLNFKPVSFDASSNDQFIAFHISKWDVQTFSNSDTIKITDQVGNEIKTLALGVGFQPSGLKFSPKSNYLMYADYVDFGRIQVYDTKTWNKKFTTHDFKSGVRLFEISPDEKYIATTSFKHHINIWDIESGELVDNLDLHVLEITSIAFIPGNRLAIGTKEGKIMILHDFHSDGRSDVRTKGAHQSAVQEIFFSADTSFLISRSTDGILKTWKIKENEDYPEVATITTTMDKYVIATPDKYYTTKEGYDLVGFRAKDKTYPFEQFDIKLNRPDIIIERLGFASKEKIDAYKKAYQKRLQKMGFEEEMLNNDFHVPEIEIINEENIPGTSTEKEISLELKAYDSRYYLDRYNVWVNDVPVFGLKGISIKDFQTKNHNRKVKISLSEGENKIQTSVHNVNGVESIKTLMNVFYEGEQDEKDLYVLTIGVSKYKSAKFNLNYAAKDAEDIAFYYKAAIGFKEVHTMSLLDKEVTLENILKAKSFLNESKIDDQVILFVAGHGLLDDNLNYYFGTSNINFKTPEKNGLPYEKLESLLDSIPARKKLMLIDACHSGEIDKEEIEKIENINQEKGEVSFRGFKKVTNKNIGLKNSFELMKNLFVDLRRGTGSTIISSAGGVEFAYESSEWQNGVFTYALLNGLKTMEADLNEDGKVMASELKIYIEKKVVQLTNGGQKPTTREENLAYDFVVW